MFCPVTLRDEESFVWGFVCTNTDMLRVILKYVATDAVNPPRIEVDGHGVRFAGVFLFEGSRGRHHSSNCERDVGGTCAWVRST